MRLDGALPTVEYVGAVMLSVEDDDDVALETKPRGCNMLLNHFSPSLLLGVRDEEMMMKKQ